jgi:hypothetical protein
MVELQLVSRLADLTGSRDLEKDPHLIPIHGICPASENTMMHVLLKDRRQAHRYRQKERLLVSSLPTAFSPVSAGYGDRLHAICNAASASSMS